MHLTQKTFLIFSIIFIFNSRTPILNANAQEIAELKNEKRHFSYIVKHPKKKQIESLIRNTTINRTLQFTVSIPADIFDSLFDDLTYAVKMSRKHAKTKFNTTYIKSKGYYNSDDGRRTYAYIYPILLEKAFDKKKMVKQIKTIKSKNPNKVRRYYYYAVGTYKYVVPIKGKMLLYFGYKPLKADKNNTQFYIKAYISLNNIFLRGMLKQLLKNQSVKKFTNTLVDRTISRIFIIGKIVGYGILRDRAAKNPLPSRSKKVPSS